MVSETELRKQGAITGIYVGTIILVINILSYYAITSLQLPFWLMTVGLNVLLFLLYILTAAIFILKLRNKVGSYWTFKQAATGIFILVVVAYTINYIGRDMLFAKAIEPNMPGKTKTAIVNADVNRMEAAHFTPDSIKKSLVILDTKIAGVNKVTTLQQVAAIPILLIMLFLVSIIFAAVFKNDPPVYKTMESDPTA